MTAAPVLVPVADAPAAPAPPAPAPVASALAATAAPAPAAPDRTRRPARREAVRHLCACSPALAALITRIGPCGLVVERRRDPYEALVRAIAHQQLHGRAAEAILGRMLALHPDQPFPSPARLLATDATLLRACGFSQAKIAAIHDIARAAEGGAVPSRRAAAAMSDAALIERLTALRGVGRWTVEMLLIFTLGRADVLPVDDFGVREGWRRIHGLDAQPRPSELARLGEALSPHRSTASWYLWRAADEGKRPPPSSGGA